MNWQKVSIWVATVVVTAAISWFGGKKAFEFQLGGSKVIVEIQARLAEMKAVQEKHEAELASAGIPMPRLEKKK